MKEHYKLKGNTLALNLPENTVKHKSPFLSLLGINLIYYVESNYGEGVFSVKQFIKLPEGSWSILGRPSELTRQQKEMIIDKVEFAKAVFYKNYTKVPQRDFKDIVEAAFDTPDESFTSFLEAHGLDENTILITKNI